jgi:hypothetical protein
MHVFIGIGTRDKDHTRAYFFCPTCRARKACVQGSRTQYLTLFFVPVLPVGRIGEYYRCAGCHRQFDPDANFPYDYGDHPSPKLWTCSRCRSTNPSHAFRCQVCGSDA